MASGSRCRRAASQARVRIAGVRAAPGARSRPYADRWKASNMPGSPLRQRRREARLGLVPGSVEGLAPMLLDAHQVDELPRSCSAAWAIPAATTSPASANRPRLSSSSPGRSTPRGDSSLPCARATDKAACRSATPAAASRPRPGRGRGSSARATPGPVPPRVREHARPFQHGQRRGGPTGQDEPRAVVGGGGRQRGAGGGRLQCRDGTRAEPFGLLTLAGHEQVPREPHEHGGDGLGVRRGVAEPAPAAPAARRTGATGVGEPVREVELPRLSRRRSAGPRRCGTQQVGVRDRASRWASACRATRPAAAARAAPAARTRRSSRRRRPATAWCTMRFDVQAPSASTQRSAPLRALSRATTQTPATRASTVRGGPARAGRRAAVAQHDVPPRSLGGDQRSPAVLASAALRDRAASTSVGTTD